MAQSTWAAKTETWATDTHVWANDTYTGSATLDSTSDFDLGYNTKYVVTANMTQVNLSELNEEDVKKVATALLGLAAGTTASCAVAVPVVATLANTQNIRNNTSFEERVTLSLNNATISDNNFLWNNVTEDTATTWTKVADADE